MTGPAITGATRTPMFCVMMGLMAISLVNLAGSSGTSFMWQMGQAVGSYVVETPRGPISIIVVPQEPQAMGMTEHAEAGGKTFWTGAFAKNSMVAVCLGGYTYCAVAEVPQELLTQILLSLGLNN